MVRHVILWKARSEFIGLAGAVASALVGCVGLSDRQAVVDGGSVVTLTTESATAKIALDGARVISYVSGGREVLWSPKVPGVPGTGWIHGGIPVCWPYFGGKASETCPPHGFARDCRFKVVDSSSSAVCSRVLLQLESSEETRRTWPHDFTLQVEVTLTDSLHLTLRTLNRGKDAFAFTGGFHPYFRLGDVAQARVTGVDGLRFCDSRVTSEFGGPWTGDLRLSDAHDHVFIETTTTAARTIIDPVLGRTIDWMSSGVPRLVLWNPGPEDEAADNPAPGQLATGDWRHIACVEPALIWKDAAVTLPPGGRHEIAFEISVRNE